MILAIDPGQTHHGLVLYDEHARWVSFAHSKVNTDDVIRAIRTHVANVAIERVQSYGIPGRSLLETAENFGRLYQAAADTPHVHLIHTLYRREVLRHLDVAGKGNRDALVRERMLEMHPGGKGRKACPGPLYGVSGHAWAALAVAVTAAGL